MTARARVAHYERATGEQVEFLASPDFRQLRVVIDGSPARTITINAPTMRQRAAKAWHAAREYEENDLAVAADV